MVRSVVRILASDVQHGVPWCCPSRQIWAPVGDEILVYHRCGDSPGVTGILIFKWVTGGMLECQTEFCK